LVQTFLIVTAVYVLVNYRSASVPGH